MTVKVRPSGKKHVIGIIGVRDYRGDLYQNSNYVIKTFERHLILNGIATGNLVLVTGGGKGVESIVCDWAGAKGIPVLKIPPTFKTTVRRKRSSCATTTWSHSRTN